jgi:tetratricopeptide (TPR) repeat protein
MLPKDSRIGPYRIEEHLGGTTCEVYRAWDEQLRRPVAIKRPRAGAGDAVTERFRRCAAIAAELDHPAIVHIHALLTSAESDTGGAGDLLVMELVAGEPLARLLERGGIAAPLAQRVAAQLGGAVAAAHGRGIVHGDLTAERVIVRPDGQAKILGFGFGGPPPAAAEGDGGLAAAKRTDLDTLAALLRQLSSRTQAMPARPETSAAPPAAVEWPAGTAAAPPASTPRAWRWRLGSRARRGLAGAGLLAASVAGGLVWLRTPGNPSYVAVPEPSVGRGAGPEVARLGDGLRLALLHALFNLDGIVPLAAPASQGDGAGSGPPLDAAARRVGAGEVLASHLSCRPSTCEVTLSRLIAGAGAGGSRLLWTETIETPAGQPYLLAVAVESAMRRAYNGSSQRPGARPLEVSPADFDGFLALRQRLRLGAGAAAGPPRVAAVADDVVPAGGAVDGGAALAGTPNGVRAPTAAPHAAPAPLPLAQSAGVAPPAAALNRLRALLSGSPRFVEALELAAALQERERPDEALAVLRQAADLAPADPRPLCQEFELLLASRRFVAARQALAALDRRQPADSGNLVRRARLRASSGQLRLAMDDLRAAVRSRPAAADLLRLAALEAGLGDPAAARSHLGAARARLADDGDGAGALRAAGQGIDPAGGTPSPRGGSALLAADCGCGEQER